MKKIGDHCRQVLNFVMAGFKYVLLPFSPSNRGPRPIPLSLFHPDFTPHISSCLIECLYYPLQLIHLAGAQKPVLAKGSQELIRSFFMASRRIRSTGAFGADIPATAINSM